MQMPVHTNFDRITQLTFYTFRNENRQNVSITILTKYSLPYIVSETKLI